MTAAEFQQVVIAAVEKHGVRGVADRIAVSPASVQRYVSGANGPHPLMRDVFARILARP